MSLATKMKSWWLSRKRLKQVLDQAVPLKPSYESPGREGDAARQRRICMVAYATYESDNRVRRYAEALAKRGDKVDVISAGIPRADGRPININSVVVYHVYPKRQNESSHWTYAWESVRFLFISSRHLTRLHRRNRYDVIHIHNIPDFLVFAAWYPKATGAKVILDIHDAVPELFASKFDVALKPAYIAILRFVEKVSARLADHVIIANDLWFETITTRSIPQERCSVFINHVDPDLFAPRARTRDDGRFIVLFPGSLQWHQGVDIAIRAFALIRRRVPTAEFHIYSGGGNRERELRALVKDLSLDNSVYFFKSVSLDDIPQIIANADLGVVPKRADSFGNEAYSTKIMEFLSQGVPVVASRTKVDSLYYEEGVIHFFEPGNYHAMAEAMTDVIFDRKLSDSLISRGYKYVERNGWNCKRHEYLNLVDALAAGR